MIGHTVAQLYHHGGAPWQAVAHEVVDVGSTGREVTLGILDRDPFFQVNIRGLDLVLKELVIATLEGEYVFRELDLGPSELPDLEEPQGPALVPLHGQGDDAIDKVVHTTVPLTLGHHHQVDIPLPEVVEDGLLHLLP